jgi:hypothetical protein
LLAVGVDFRVGRVVLRAYVVWVVLSPMSVRRGGLALCAISVLLPFWLVYPMNGSIVSISMLIELFGWISIPWENFDGGSGSSRSL